MVNFAKLKKNSDQLSKLADQINKAGSNEEYGDKDDRFWNPTRDKAGNGYAVIRFLPGPSVDGEDSQPFVSYWRHGFQGPTGKWYIENSLTTIKKDDPVSDLNRRLWNTKDDKYVEVARKQKRQLRYVSNIMVIEDSANPENVGKVFLFRYGQKIFDKIKLMMFPVLPGKPKVNPFDFWEGANFMLSVRTVSKFPNYDLSEFAQPTPLRDNDKEMEAIWLKEYSLADFVSADKFKTYDELKSKLDATIGCDSASDDVFTVLLSKPGSAPQSASPVKAFQKKAKTVEEDTSEETETPPWETESGNSSDDEDLAYFEKMANEK